MLRDKGVSVSHSNMNKMWDGGGRGFRQICYYIAGEGGGERKERLKILLAKMFQHLKIPKGSLKQI